jgi:alpha-beta hydrolase superfamily lysophospholipase
METRTFVDDHGVTVTSRWWRPASPQAAVVIAHGASEHGGRYERFATALVDAGYAVAAVDHRGHGATGPHTGVGLTGPGGGDAIIDNLHQLQQQLVDEAGGVPCFVFGHSMGSLLALVHLTRFADELAGGVLCGFPADPTGVDAIGGLLQAMADAGLRDEPAADLLASNNAPFEPARTPYDWLSRDTAEVDAYVADPACGDGNPLTYGYLLELFKVVEPAMAQFASITCPVLVIAGDQDPAAGMGSHPEALAEALRSHGTDTELTLYPGARHELLNETNRDVVTADLVAWFDRRR